MEKNRFIEDIKSFPLSFWALNLIQFMEKCAFMILWVQVPIYIAQKDAPGGLHWEQYDLGVIILWWVLIQRIPPLFFGGLTDKTGYKKMLFASFALISAGYIVMGFAKEFYPLLGGVLILGLGSGLFLPAIQGLIARKVDKKNTSLAWSIYYMTINLASFCGIFISKNLKAVSWEAIFWGSAIIVAFNFVFMILVPGEQINRQIKSEKTILIVKRIFKTLFTTHVGWFVLIMSGFSIIYIQFYKIFTNFIYDWVDTSSIASSLRLPEEMLTNTARGTMISYEWMINLNTIVVISGIVIAGWLMSGMKRLNALLIGMIIVSLGIGLLGSSMLGYTAIFGIIIYSLGELIVNPKFNEYLGSIASKSEKALYMSYLNISFAIGLGFGSVYGSSRYQAMAEKAGLAKKYLVEILNYDSDSISLSNSMDTLQNALGIDSGKTTELLWNTYNPQYFWIPFLIIGIASTIGIFIYSRKVRNY